MNRIVVTNFILVFRYYFFSRKALILDFIFFVVNLICFIIVVLFVNCFCQTFCNCTRVFVFRITFDYELVLSRPPRRVGNDKSCLSTSEQLNPPVLAGMNSFRIISSKGCKLIEISGIVRSKYRICAGALI